MSDQPIDDDNRSGRSIESDDEARISRLQDDISRLRSVLFMLVKDQPDMLRLLGLPETPSDEGQK
ncbi:MAG TPA: hypothetical protein VE360_09440 [Pyrinomonadaceae bacterium]|nr:hypothetical protein [Pyrinomonadaceae bacterium]